MRKISYLFGADSFCAASEEETEQFMKEFLALMEKHQLIILPTYEGEISLHDNMRVIPFDQETFNIIKRKTEVIFES